MSISDTSRQVKMIQMYSNHLSHLYQREVSLDEAAIKWGSGKLAKLYRARYSY